MLQTTNQISYFGVKLNHVKSIEKSNSTAQRLCFAHAESVREVAESTLGSCRQSFPSFPDVGLAILTSASELGSKIMPIIVQICTTCRKEGD